MKLVDLNSQSFNILSTKSELLNEVIIINFLILKTNKFNTYEHLVCL